MPRAKERNSAHLRHASLALRPTFGADSPRCSASNMGPSEQVATSDALCRASWRSDSRMDTDNALRCRRAIRDGGGRSNGRGPHLSRSPLRGVSVCSAGRFALSRACARHAAALLAVGRRECRRAELIRARRRCRYRPRLERPVGSKRLGGGITLHMAHESECRKIHDRDAPWADSIGLALLCRCADDGCWLEASCPLSRWRSCIVEPTEQPSVGFTTADNRIRSSDKRSCGWYWSRRGQWSEPTNALRRSSE